MAHSAFFRRRTAAVVAAASLLATPVAAVTWTGTAVAHAQDATIPVPAGQTTTVSLPVPVDVTMAANGWNVSASGGTATVTAPEAGGQISVPVTYEGVTMTFLLVADAQVTEQDLNDAAANGDPGSVAGDAAPGGGDAAPGAPAPDAPNSGDPAPGAHGGAESGENGSAGEREGGEAHQGAPSHPRTGRGWEGVDDSHTEYVNLESTIDGQTITAKLGFKQALDLYNRFKHLEDDGVTLRYLNAQGEFVDGVKREIDKASRTMTLTYPEGTQPDNPFIMQFVNKEAQTAELVVTLTDPNAETAQDVPAEQQLGADTDDNSDTEGGEEPGRSTAGLLTAIGGAGIVALIAGLSFWWWRRRKSSH